jgi:hypothetical protein
MTGTDFVYNPPPFFQREVKARRGRVDGLGLAPPPGELSAPIPREAQTERVSVDAQPSPPQCEHWGTSPKGGGKKRRAKRAQYTSKRVYCALDNTWRGKAYSVVFTD